MSTAFKYFSDQSDSNWNLLKVLLFSEGAMSLLFLICLVLIFIKLLQIRAFFYSFFMKVPKSQATHKLELIQHFYKSIFQTQLFNYNPKIMELLQTDLKDENADNDVEEIGHSKNFNEDIERYKENQLEKGNQKIQNESNDNVFFSFRITTLFAINFGIRKTKRFFFSFLFIVVFLLFVVLIGPNLQALENLMSAIQNVNFHITDINTLPIVLISGQVKDSVLVPFTIEICLSERQSVIENTYSFFDMVNNEQVYFLSKFYAQVNSMMLNDYSKSLLQDNNFISKIYVGVPDTSVFIDKLDKITLHTAPDISTIQYFINGTSEILQKGFKTITLSNIDFNDYLLQFYLNPGLANSTPIVQDINQKLLIIVQYLWLDLLNNAQGFYMSYYQVIILIITILAIFYGLILCYVLFFIVKFFLKESQDEIYFGQNVLNLIDDVSLKNNKLLTELILNWRVNAVI